MSCSLNCTLTHVLLYYQTLQSLKLFNLSELHVHDYSLNLLSPKKCICKACPSLFHVLIECVCPFSSKKRCVFLSFLDYYYSAFFHLPGKFPRHGRCSTSSHFTINLTLVISMETDPYCKHTIVITSNRLRTFYHIV